jgi:2-methylisocitrate lyase-like PEP mutase family enzyme
MPTQADLAHAFQALHGGTSAFLIPNPWDAGTARLLASLGFQALATTSAGQAFARGEPDGSGTRDAVLAHVRAIAASTDLPVSADLEHGFGDDPDAVVQTLQGVVEAGAVGASIEDARRDGSIYEIGEAAARLRAAADWARALPFPFMLTGRAENYLHGRPDLADTIARLQAYQEAGASVLYAPGLARREDIAAVVASVDRPVNVLMGLSGNPLTLADVSAIGVKRVSIGSALSRAAFGAVRRAATEMREHGTFRFADEALSYRELNDLFGRCRIS